MLSASCDKALKEWAISCQALREGRQILLIRKGGLREAGFQVEANAFFLLPGYEHQKRELLQPEWAERLTQLAQPDPGVTTFDTFAMIDSVLEARDEEQIRRVSQEHIWAPELVRMRFNFNPYSPLSLLVLRAYRLAEAISILTRPSFGGCRSWVTLDEPIAFENAEPAVPDDEFAARRTHLLEALAP